MLWGSGFAYAEINYTTSAHGCSNGVDRCDPTEANPFPEYAVGNCAHCHEQHASIGGSEPVPSSGTASGFCLLANNFNTSVTEGPGSSFDYAKADNACFYCHTSSSSLQTDGITNNDYSETFGNASSGQTGIFETFKQLSYHKLKDILTFVTGKSFPTFTSNSNPCSGCHNVHIAKRNKAFPGNPAYTAISKPSVHDELWGDADPDERMTNSALYGTYYQPPYYTSTNLEPDGVSSDRETQAGKTPDYVTFCQDCHTTQMHTSPYAFGLTNTPINWATTGGESGGDKHGKNVATIDSTDPDVYVNLNAPYAATWTTSGFVLACTDCHEPHGSPNVMLIRRQVNGSTVSGITSYSTTNWTNLCARCHACSSSDALENIHHDDTGAPYNGYTQCGKCHPGSSGSWSCIQCNNCHFHGGSDTVWVTAHDKTPSDRRTF